MNFFPLICNSVSFKHYKNFKLYKETFWIKMGEIFINLGKKKIKMHIEQFIDLIFKDLQ
jgi:hypothetical protein